MAISKMCDDFDTFRKFFRDELKGSGEYDFNSRTFKKYCPKESCNNDIDKINAGCLWLIYELFVKLSFSADPNTLKNDSVSIIIWLGYILNLKPHEGINTINDFYSKHIQDNAEYSKHKIDDKTYTDYKKIIDKVEEYMNINIDNMPKFYESLKLLCNMYTAYTKKNNSDFSKYTNKFIDKYKELFDDDKNIKDSSYNKILNVLSNYYYYFGKGIRFNDMPIDRPSLPTEKTLKKDNPEDPKVTKATKGTEISSEEDKSDIETIQSYDTILSGSSLVNKLVIVLPILAAIAIFWGIAYKYSLFGFRKRSKKQHLREKLKK
ncbi:PIR protein [Plasmodium yoelii]|nr:PIR protein [Plasmodium yoelii]CDU15984.1 YIR protein [Plasmodium yoelii]VTZ71579.1 PIR protein [Plasmodium yoelii]|eukprot:XP_022811286.1 PIR protein [Plasmodium yoelii]